MGKFTIEIQLGNEAMQNGHDIAECLEKIVSALREGLEPGHPVKLYDQNGNRVGLLTFDYEEE